MCGACSGGAQLGMPKSVCAGCLLAHYGAVALLPGPFLSILRKLMGPLLNPAGRGAVAVLRGRRGSSQEHQRNAGAHKCTFLSHELCGVSVLALCVCACNPRAVDWESLQAATH